MTEFDTVIVNGSVIDGLNTPRQKVDVAIRDGRIAKIGLVDRRDSAEVIDAEGLIVAPGYVDLHTHYDAQLFWDPYCTISGWHGVTSVAIGNCGFGFAPARKEDQDYLMKSLNRVEAIPEACIRATMPWSWESFPEWLDALEATPKGVNVLTLVPLNPLLVYVMGLDASKSRDPSAEELAKMKSLLREALEAGACGLSAQMTPPGSGADFQRDYDGSPFATDVMSKGTMLDLTRVLADFDGTAIQTVLSTNDGLEADQRFMEELAVESKGTVVFNAIGPFQGDRRGLHKGLIEWIRSCRERSIGVWAQMVTNGEIFTVTFEDWNMFDEMPAWREAMLGSPSERLEKLSDPARREALRSQPPSAFPLDDAVILRTESEQFQAIKGTKLQDAARILGYENQIDLLLDVVIADELRTLIQIPHVADDPDSLREIATEPYGIWGVSDGGAHTKFITLGSYPTENITKFVREDAWMTLEEAHSRLSFLPARAGGFKDRGALLPGAPADIVVYDYDNLELLDEEVAHDYPAGEWRRIRRAKGYRRVLVNGQSTIVDDEFTGATPGCLLRGGRAPE